MECENEDVEVTSSHASRVPIETRIEGVGVDVTWLCTQKQIKRKGKYIILIKMSSEKPDMDWRDGSVAKMLAMQA